MSAKTVPVGLQRLQRWILLAIFWITYIVFRSSLQGSMEYDYRKDKMIIRCRPRWITMLGDAVLVVAILAMGILLLFSLILCFQYHIPLVFWILFFVVLENWYVVWMILRLRNPSCNRSCVKAANEVITLNKEIKRLFPTSAQEGSHLLIIFAITCLLHILEIYSCFVMTKSFLVWISLVQLSYNAFAAYQLLVISWISSINQYLRTYQQSGNPSRRQRAKLLRLLKLYERISNIHRDINRIWLRISSILISDFLFMVYKLTLIIFTVVYIRTNALMKWNGFWRSGHFSCIAPIMRILFIAICNYRLAQLESCIRVQMLIISISHRNSEDLYTFQISKLQTGFDLQLQTQPLRNKILNCNLECGFPFLLDYFVFVFTTVLSFVQYLRAGAISIWFNPKMKIEVDETVDTLLDRLKLKKNIH